jgi:adenosylmethionine-8-amino-7-oxononanoate aminotransferase
VEFHERAPDWQACIDGGLYLVTREKSLILAPPFVSSPPRLERAFAALDKVLDAMVMTIR